MKKEINLKVDAFVAEMMAKHPELKAMKDQLSFWQKDPRAKLLGEWVCEDLPSVEFKITVEDNYFLLSICVTKWGESDYSYYPLHQGETDRLYYFIRKGKVVEMMIQGDMDYDGEEDGPQMCIDGYCFTQVEGTCAFIQENQAMTDDDTVGIAAMEYKN